MTATVLDRPAFDALLAALVRRGYGLVGATARDGAIVYGEIEGADDLPAGWGDEQDGGSYRLRERGDGALFGHDVGATLVEVVPASPRRLRLWRARREEDGALAFDEELAEPPRQAFIGVRSCDLHAIAIQDRVFMEGAHADPDYAARRTRAFIVAVNCGQAGGDLLLRLDGHRARGCAGGFDIALTELLDEGGHRFLAEAGSEEGAEVLAELPQRRRHGRRPQRPPARATDARRRAAWARTLDAGGIKDLLARNLEHPRWDEVADRCLSCGNCTMVCPTCFCTTSRTSPTSPATRPSASGAWDSCFTLGLLATSTAAACAVTTRRATGSG